MRRGNTDAEYRLLVKKLRDNVPQLTLATDIIVGFPEETEEQYWDTIKLVRDTTPDIVNISRFWPRPKTPAAAMKQLPGEVVKHRSRVLTEIFENISKMQNEKWIGWEGTIRIGEKGKFENQWIGRNDSYKPVIVEGDYKIGDVLKVKAVKAGTYDVRAKVIE